MNGTQVPIGVKIIAVLYCTFSFCFLILGKIFFDTAIEEGRMDEEMTKIFGLKKPIVPYTVQYLVTGAIVIGLGVLGFCAGVDLWRRKARGRVTIIILTFFVMILIIVRFIIDAVRKELSGADIISIPILIISTIIVCYLMFNENVRKAFSAKNLNLEAKEKVNVAELIMRILGLK